MFPQLKQREISDELLDRLAPETCEARRSRRDLRRVNAWMGHASLIAAALRSLFPDKPPRLMADLGGGDGALMLEVARLLDWPSLDLIIVDQFQLLDQTQRAAMAELGWRVQPVKDDIFRWLHHWNGKASLMTANLFLHHFSNDHLRDLLGAVSLKTDAFAACEPRRAPLALAASRMLWLIGCNKITRHDAPVSVRAGFTGRELSSCWPRENGWKLQENNAGLFSHVFLAGRLIR